MTIFRLITASLIPVVFAVIFYLLDKKTKYSEASYWLKQVITGFVFGGIACLATEFGIPVEGAVLNVRNAAPLTAGLLFGGPAGLIAGLIGGVHRWFSVLWGISEYSQLACTIATVLAGIIGASTRKFMFDNKKSSWLYGLIIGITSEVLHMLILFLTKLEDIKTAFTIVAKCAFPMIIANGISVMLSLLIISIIGKEKFSRRKEKKQLTQSFQSGLLISVAVAFGVTTLFTYYLQSKISETDTSELLSLNITDVKQDITDASDHHLLGLTNDIKEELEASELYLSLDEQSKDSEREQKRRELEKLLDKYNVSEINIIDKNGIIMLSTYKDFDLYYMGSDMNGQAAEFLCLLDGKTEYVQDYQPTDFAPDISRKYAGVTLSDGGFVQVGYDAEQFQDSIDDEIELVARNRHIGQEGYIVIRRLDDKELVSTSAPENIRTLLADRPLDVGSKKEGECFYVSFGEEFEYFAMFEKTNGYIILAYIPAAQAQFSKDIAVYISLFMQILVFVALFVNVYFLVKKIIVDNIHKINNSLAKITSGNLNTTVDVRDNEEFACLSDDINSTVNTLKAYIAEAEARIDKELEFAKNIQTSALPNVFPPYPNRNDFDIYATMNAAKEVGGDFYDFYLLDNDRLGILIADVSGKSIPGAMFMMRSKTILKSLAESGMEVNDIFTAANKKLCEGNDAAMFVTAWLGIIDLRTGMLSYANAGHNPPLIRHKNGEFEYVSVRPNFVLAGMETAKYKKHELQLLPGDEIFIYTDGVTEATDNDNQLFGEERLLQAVNSNPDEDVESRCRTVKNAIDEFVGEAEQFDDITMLTVKLKFFQSYDCIKTTPDLQSAEVVRDFIERVLNRAEIPVKFLSKCQIVVDEIYSNILHYSDATQAEVYCSFDDSQITLKFADNGKQYNPLEKEDPDITLSAEERQIGGLGIFMVKKMASKIEYQYVDEQNILSVSFKLDK